MFTLLKEMIIVEKEIKKDVKVSNIYPGDPLHKELLALTTDDEIAKVTGKALLSDVAKRYKGASFIVVGKTRGPMKDQVYFRIIKDDIEE